MVGSPVLWLDAAQAEAVNQALAQALGPAITNPAGQMVRTITLPVCAKCGRAVDEGYGIIVYGTIVKADQAQELLAGDPQGQEAMAYHAICIARILNQLIGDAVHKECKC